MEKHIDIFETIYDIDVVIANKAVTLDDLNTTYEYSDGCELQDKNWEAMTCMCRNKQTKKLALLVWYRVFPKEKGINKTLRYINTAAHEALHVTLELQRIVGEQINTDDTNEYLAYLVGYLTENIYNTWTKK